MEILTPVELAKHRHYNCRKPEHEIAKALHGNNRADFLFGLKQEYQAYKFLQKQLNQCDKEIEKALKIFLKRTLK